jgi:hypothetical protein
MAKAKRERRTSIRNMGAGDDALAALERLEQMEKRDREAAQPEADPDPDRETAAADDD